VQFGYHYNHGSTRTRTHSFIASTAKLEAKELCHGELEQDADVKGGVKKNCTMIK